MEHMELSTFGKLDIRKIAYVCFMSAKSINLSYHCFCNFAAAAKANQFSQLLNENSGSATSNKTLENDLKPTITTLNTCISCVKNFH